ncbi:LytTR family DNA-binding domain-containing protein [Amycolatopsis acidiphila]|uniref:Response regulator transcription factor n=1 Tax=Amycolatopsis acidiphila TaxID=715473 RepID=A0A558A1C0_9PSEU|nr:LytTR family DNA-binding domain-containing protein [Amycolatopsis acidiphila]TVT18052.1 response regulator transcription factor [Amycolatopsis acidiphila]UIJ56622.1 LytTR family DNA-binding domain-containing protein [Amycolatopsis acidiphila]GHG56183.1 DNA-binding response regulator [Amycolatopsis acidiphila]
MTGLRVLAVDDLRPALDELARMLHDCPEVGEVTAVADPLSAVRSIQAGGFDAAFLDIAMPGMDGLELASLLSKLNTPPVLVFVTAHDKHALTAFGVGAVDYVLKPIRAERLSAALTKVNRMVHALRSPVPPAPETLPALAVEAQGRTRYVHRDDVHFVEAHGDHVRLHTGAGVHEVRMPMARLEEYWESSGFARVHRGYLVALRAVRELRSDSVGGLLAHTGAGDVPVSRRHSRELRERLLEAARQGELSR